MRLALGQIEPSGPDIKKFVIIPASKHATYMPIRGDKRAHIAPTLMKTSPEARTIVFVVENMAVHHHGAVEVVELLTHRVGLRSLRRALVGTVVNEHVLPVALAKVIVVRGRCSLLELQQHSAFTTR